MSFEEWLKKNETCIRQIQNDCSTGHAEGGVHWWDTRVDLECSSCGRRPGQKARVPCSCPPLEDYPLCDCNARVIYERLIAQTNNIVRKS